MATNKFDAIKVGLASPERITEWSYGEVTKPETINYRSQKPEKDGLFCEKIFGPTKDWECSCGKYKKVRFKGVICDRCGVEITKSSVRRERMGRITLAAPVAHIWYLKGIPSRMSLVLNIPAKTLEEIVYFVTWIVTDPGNTDLEYKQVMNELEVRNQEAIYGKNAFKAQTGAEAIDRCLSLQRHSRVGKHQASRQVAHAASGIGLSGRFASVVQRIGQYLLYGCENSREIYRVVGAMLYHFPFAFVCPELEE